ncbi:MAG: metallophosphoesterase [Kangiellaceae bacterium]|nr:metallophosphoesterase [Kangiellaceae bacterium]MCW9018390.1 metallophosphoesterase [Kangiellaceae bacterium]
MRVFAVSDIHIDYKDNMRWMLGLSSQDFQSDVLILAGDVSDNLELLAQCFEALAKKFLKVLFVPGNHELWVSHELRGKQNDKINSIEKYHQISELATQSGVATQSYIIGDLTLVPLLAWYDYSFAKPCDKLKSVWMDFRLCAWPDDMQAIDVTHFFLEKNRNYLQDSNQTVISFSHFLPRIDLMPFYVPQKYRYLYPALGSELLEEQIRVLNPDIHVYGHSHLNIQQTIDNILYVNNAFGYPSENNITNKELLCIYEQ